MTGLSPQVQDEGRVSSLEAKPLISNMLVLLDLCCKNIDQGIFTFNIAQKCTHGISCLDELVKLICVWSLVKIFVRILHRSCTKSLRNICPFMYLYAVLPFNYSVFVQESRQAIEEAISWIKIKNRYIATYPHIFGSLHNNHKLEDARLIFNLVNQQNQFILL